MLCIAISDPFSHTQLKLLLFLARRIKGNLIELNIILCAVYLESFTQCYSCLPTLVVDLLWHQTPPLPFFASWMEQQPFINS